MEGPTPFTVGKIKIWPVGGQQGNKWFIAFEGKPHYFKSRAEAMLFASHHQKPDEA